MGTIHARHRLRNLLPLFRVRRIGGASGLRRDSRVTFRTLGAETCGSGTGLLISRLPSLDLDAGPLLSRSGRSQSGSPGRIRTTAAAVRLPTRLSQRRGHLTGDGCLAVACVPGPGCRKFWCSSELAGPLAMDHPSRADNRCFRVVPDLEADSLGPLSHRRDARSLHSSGGRGGENPSRADPSGRHRLDSNPDVARAGR